MTTKSIQTYDELYNSAKEYIKEEEDLRLISKAFLFAFEKHFGQLRRTGEDYINHPLNVAYILSTINADSATLAAALLHDVMEDCAVEEEELQEKFGDEVASLVKGVTKINRLSFSGDNEAVILNHRKILVGLCEDVRVIIIKLADRLHNMRTLWALPEDRQRYKAKETLDILTPIAHRLGMSNIKSELEDLSLRYYKPDAYFSIVEKLNQTKIERENLVLDMMQKVTEILNEHHIEHEIKGRAKAIYSIYNKLNKGKKFSDIYDLLALRVYVKTEQECYQALGIIHAKYKPLSNRFKDYIAMPKTNMYQSLHTTVFGPGGNLFEIQIRTYEMDKIAEHGIASHWSYKEGGKANLQSAMEQKLQFFRAMMELKNEEETPEEFVRSVQEDLFKDTIYVFTPKGDVIELPTGSTPIDFAYRVHSEVGDKMVGAIVNNTIVPLDYELHDNDIVKINTNKSSSGPSQEWINMAHTTQAKNKIKAFFNKMDKKDYLKIGQENLNKELRKRKIAFNDFFKPENMEILTEEFKISTEEELYIQIGSSKLTPSQIIHAITKENTTKEELILKKTQNKEVSLPHSKNDIIVKGIDEIKVNIASCCKPIPGDALIGYITKGYGITAHCLNCPNVASLDERIIELSWNEVTTKKYPTNVLVHVLEGKNVLLDIIAKTSNNDVVIQSINVASTQESNVYELVVLVANKEVLTKFMNDIRSLKDVLDVERNIL